MTNRRPVPPCAHSFTDLSLTSTGMSSDRHGQSVTNSYRYFKPDGTALSSYSFKYWTDWSTIRERPADPLPNMVNADSGTPRNAPAPWVPYTRAGCDFGAVALTNIVLRNAGTGPAGDIQRSSAQFRLNSVNAVVECSAGEHCGAKPCPD